MRRVKRPTPSVFYTKDSKDKKAKWNELDEDFLRKNTEIISEIYSRNMLDIDRDNVFVSAVGSCQGDSGGPLMVKGKSFFLLHQPLI